MKRTMFLFLSFVTSLAVCIGLYMAFIYAPPEKQMGDLQRIMYFHVSSAIVCFFAFFGVFAAGLMYLFTRNKKWDHLAYASAEVGIFFTTLVLITGPLWARPIWNTWWTWDPRLTTTLILWFIYIAYMLLRSSIADDVRRRVVSSIFGIIGFIDVPIIHYSVTWWRAIHPNVISNGQIHMDARMTAALITNMVAFFLLCIL